MNKLDKKYDYNRKFQEYQMKIVKMAGYLSDYYIDRAIESDDYSTISSFLIGYLSAGKSVDIGYLVSKYKEFGLDEKIEDLDFSVDEWYKIKYEMDMPEFFTEEEVNIKMTEEEYIQFMIDKRKKEIDE